MHLQLVTRGGLGVGQDQTWRFFELQAEGDNQQRVPDIINGPSIKYRKEKPLEARAHSRVSRSLPGPLTSECRWTRMDFPDIVGSAQLSSLSSPPGIRRNEDKRSHRQTAMKRDLSFVGTFPSRTRIKWGKMVLNWEEKKKSCLDFVGATSFLGSPSPCHGRAALRNRAPEHYRT